MAYNDSSGFSFELANKIGHIKLLKDPLIQKIVESFEDNREFSEEFIPKVSGSLNLENVGQIEQIITIDGGHQIVPNSLRTGREVGFIQVASQLIKLETIQYLKDHPMTDPRDLREKLGKFTHHILAVLPVSGVNVLGLTVKQSIRETIHRFITNYELYKALAFLVHREWEMSPKDKPSMDCLSCSSRFCIPKGALIFRCPKCNGKHFLSDYLGLSNQDSEDRARAEIVSNFRTVLETLVIFSFVIGFRNNEYIMGKTLFLLDGPLTLRAQLSRLVEPIRDFIEYQKSMGKSLFLVGVEKSGEIQSFADIIGNALDNEGVFKYKSGDFFLPSVKFIVEQIQGKSFNQDTYRNRVNYGTKVIIKLGENHILSLNVPTGQLNLEPEMADLVGFRELCICLSKVLSFSFKNALIPIVLVNSEASISNRPSGGILAQFVSRIINQNA